MSKPASGDIELAKAAPAPTAPLVAGEEDSVGAAGPGAASSRKSAAAGRGIFKRLGELYDGMFHEGLVRGDGTTFFSLSCFIHIKNWHADDDDDNDLD